MKVKYVYSIYYVKTSCLGEALIQFSTLNHKYFIKEVRHRYLCAYKILAIKAKPHKK